MIDRAAENLVGRLHGPMTFRLILQPLTAVFFAVRAGMKDARADRPAYLWAVATDPEQRRALIREGWRDVARVFFFAVVVDAVYQWMEIKWFYPGEALIVAAALAVVPYVLIRGPVARAARRVAR